ncbi:hypothetical protein M0R45_020716 [Rubus argutus]|uniref:Uncharacterized protein n=1 Tax=Rubus argutus TaxID=59490 RepID=A0AAW1XB23_RUBAR
MAFGSKSEYKAPKIGWEKPKKENTGLRKQLIEELLLKNRGFGVLGSSIYIFDQDVVSLVHIVQASTSAMMVRKVVFVLIMIMIASSVAGSGGGHASSHPSLARRLPLAHPPPIARSLPVALPPPRTRPPPKAPRPPRRPPPKAPRPPRRPPPKAPRPPRRPLPKAPRPLRARPPPPATGGYGGYEISSSNSLMPSYTLGSVVLCLTLHYLRAVVEAP